MTPKVGTRSVKGKSGAMRKVMGLLLAAVLLAGSGGCAGWLSGCTGPSDKLPCTCGGQTNPGCVAPLNDDMQPGFQDAKRKTDGGTDK